MSNKKDCVLSNNYELFRENTKVNIVNRRGMFETYYDCCHEIMLEWSKKGYLNICLSKIDVTNDCKIDFNTVSRERRIQKIFQIDIGSHFDYYYIVKYYELQSS